MRTFNMDTIGKLAKGVANILVCGALIALPYKSVKINMGQPISKTASYDEAVKAITESSMLSSCKCEAVTILKRGEQEEYYKAVISIVKSDDLGSAKVKMIAGLNH